MSSADGGPGAGSARAGRWTISGPLTDLAGRLGDRLNTRVRIALGARKGQISIDFATVQDLRRILSDLGEELDGV